MSNTVKLKRGSGSDPSASDLVVGELAIRTDLGKIFTKKDNGNVAEISGGGGIDDGDKGDITVSNSGDTWTIDNDVVSFAKMQNIGTPSFLGRNSSGTGNVENLSVSDVRTMLNVENGATADQTASEILTLIKTVDGAGSGLDADTLDGISSASFLRSDANDTSSGTIAFGTGSLDPDSFSSHSGGFGGIQDGSGWSARGLFVHGGGTGDAAAMAHNGGALYFGIQDGANANSMETWLQVTPGTRVINFSTDNNATNVQIGGNKIFHAGNDGSGSGLDSDLLDGQEGSYYRNAGNINAGTLAAARLDTATTQSAGNSTTKIATTAFVSTAIANLIDSSPSTLNTLNELAAALGDDASFSTTVTNSIATKMPLAGGTFTGDVTFNGGAGAATIAANSDIRFTNGNWTGNTCKIQQHGNVLYIVGGSQGIIFRESGTDRFKINTDGDFVPASDSTYDIGSNSVRVANGYFDTLYGDGSNLTNLPSQTDQNFTNADHSKLDGIEASATADQTASEILTLIKTVDGSGSGLDADTLDGISSASFLRSDADDTMSANLTVDNGTSTTLSVKCDNAGLALIRANGDGQGTGAVEVGQSDSYGGGIAYNGDGSPSFASGESDDHIIFYRLDNGTRTEVFHYPYNSNTVNFNSTPTVGGVSLVKTNDTIAQATNASTLDNIDSSSFVRSDAADTLSGTYNFSANSTDVVNFSNNSTNDNRGIAFNNRTAVSADYNDGYLRLNNASEFSNGVYTPLVMRADGGFNVDGIMSINGSGNYVKALSTASDYSSLLRSNADDIATHRIQFQNNATDNEDTIASSTGSQGGIEIYNSGVGNDAFMAFHSGSDFALYFGLDADINDIAVGGWSMGANKYRIWHQNNDGSGSGLDADTVDGVHGSSFLRSDTTDTASGAITFNGDVGFNGGAYAAHIEAGSDIAFHSGNWTGNHTKIQNHSNYLYIVGASNGIVFREDGTDRWYITGAGHLVPATDSTYNIGENGRRVTNGYFDTLYGDGSNLTGISAGATGGGSDEVFYENDQTVTSNYTITNGKNAMAAGPITINSGVTVTVGSGETLTIV